MIRNLFALILALAGSVLAYAFSGGYHPVPHITPHFSSPVHVTPRVSTPHVTTAPHYTTPPRASTPAPHFEPHPFISPAHPMHWIYHRNPSTGKTDSLLVLSDGKDARPFPWRYVFGGAGVLLLVAILVAWIRRAS